MHCNSINLVRSRKIRTKFVRGFFHISWIYFLISKSYFSELRMEGPDIPGPKVWLDLNRKCEAKVIAFRLKNKVTFIIGTLVTYS